MKFVVKFSTLFTGLIAIFLAASLENPHDRHQVLPPYHASWITWEEQVFDRSIKKLHKHKLLEDKYGDKLDQSTKDKEYIKSVLSVVKLPSKKSLRRTQFFKEIEYFKI